MKLPLSGHHIDGQEIDVPEVLAINRHRIDLVRCI
jgi:hypothetical protein